jgi:hypothetical protein
MWYTILCDPIHALWVTAVIDLESQLPPFVPQCPEVHHHLIQYSILLISILINATATVLESLYGKDPEPYHTSALSGEAWVMELLSGHPE